MKRRIPIVGLVALLVLTACPASTSPTQVSFQALTGLKAAYVTASSVRQAYCAPLDPRPKVCSDTYVPLLDAYKVLVEGESLLMAYAQTKDAGTQAQLMALNAELPKLIVTLIQIAGSFKAHTSTLEPPK